MRANMLLPNSISNIIIQNYPDYPGVKSAYTDLLLHMMITPTASPLSNSDDYPNAGYPQH